MTPAGAALLVAALAAAGCAAQPDRVVVQGSSSAEGAPRCTPPTPTAATPPAGLPARPAGAVVTNVGASAVSYVLPVELDAAVTAVVQALTADGWRVRDQESEPVAAEVDFAGPRGRGRAALARLACPAGSTGVVVTLDPSTPTPETP